MVRRNWYKLSASSIRQDLGMFADFKLDYLEIVGEKITTNCKKCIFEKHYNLLLAIKTKNLTYPDGKQSGYKTNKNMAQLKLMYSGLVWQNKVFRNGDLTDADAKWLLENHPKGAGLFDILPTSKVEEVVENTIDEDAQEVYEVKEKKQRKRKSE